MFASTVSDQPSKRRLRDATRVNIHEHSEVEYWCKHLRCTRAQLIVTVHTVGPMVDNVTQFLRELLRPPLSQAIPVRNMRSPAAPDQPPSSDR